MKKSILTLTKAGADSWQTVLRNNHGRRIYIKVSFLDANLVNICECFYVDRPGRPVPLKQQTKTFKESELLEVLENELDKRFYGINLVETEKILSTEEYISFSLQNKKRKFLILISNGANLMTRLKNRTHRVIYFEIIRDEKNAFLYPCYYCDRRYKRDNSLITPAGLHTISFEYSLDAILKIVNEELNCDFTDVIITHDTFGFDKMNEPICGSI